jgi:cytochrome c oxidase subunit II
MAPAGIQAERIDDLFWAFTDVSAVVFVLVVGALVLALARRKTPDDREKTEKKEKVVAGAAVLTVVALLVLLVMSIVTSRAMASLSPKDAIQIEVTGRKWWWQFDYADADPSKIITTSYEIHIPVGRPVEFTLKSADVIHSFWVPALDGKRDAIPSKRSTMILRADKPGRYEGQCAEFCGVQHANMRFVVVAESQEAYDAWRMKALTPAKAPADDLQKKGLDVFMKSRCQVCHTIAGTEARGGIGPGLTHVASQKKIAQTLDNNPGHLAGWIVDPQGIKPGVAMPRTPLPPDELQALVAYLGSLQ